MENPEVKIATRNMFYDEQGKHRRTKKEITDEQGNIRAGCCIIQKGEVYESRIFTKKEEWFKSKIFTKEVKEMFTEAINHYVKEEPEKLSVFQQGGVYLPTKKIGKNNPKAAEIRADNAAGQEWNRTVDVALVGVYNKSEKLVRKYSEELRAWRNQTEQEKEKLREFPQKASVLEKLHSYQQEGRQQTKRSVKKKL